MKKIIVLLLLAIVLVSCNSAKTDDTSKAQSVELEVVGFNQEKPLKLKITASSDRIENIEILENHETEGIGKEAAEKLVAEIVEKQSVEIDTVTGATVTSKALLESVGIMLEDMSFKANK